MKVLVIPDVHGIDSWKEQIKDVLFMPDSRVVFLGDYVDNYTMPGGEIMENFNDIIDAKKRHPDQITLLLGNHDYAYLWGKIATSGFNKDMWPVYRSILTENWKLFDLAWGFQGKERYTLFTHAGLTKWFYNALIQHINDPENALHHVLVKDAEKSWEDLPLHDFLNYFKDNGTMLWKVGLTRWGTSPSGSIIWADKRDLIGRQTGDPYPGIDQIVGHTVSRFVEIRDMYGDKIYFTDVHNEYVQKLTGIMIDLK